MSLGEPIAVGRTAEIYEWGEGQILKLFRDWFPAHSVQNEARNARAVHAAGSPVPAVGEVIEINGRLRLIYERVEGIRRFSIREDLHTLSYITSPCTCLTFLSTYLKMPSASESSPEGFCDGCWWLAWLQASDFQLSFMKGG